MDSIKAIEKYTKGLTKESFMESEIAQDAVIRRIEIIGEAVKNLSKNFRQANSSIPWRSMAGMRDNLIHEYFGVDLDEVWDTARIDLPILKKQIEELIKAMNDINI